MKRARTPFKREPSSLTARTYAHVITLEGEDKYVLRYYIQPERERGRATRLCGTFIGGCRIFTRELFDRIDRHTLDVHHFSTEPTAKSD